VKEAPKKKRKPMWGLMIPLILLLIVVGFGIGYLLTSWTEAQDEEPLPVATEQTEPLTPLPDETAVAPDTTHLADTTATPPAAEPAAESVAAQPAESAAPILPKSVQEVKVAPKAKSAYRIVGTKATHVLKEGETLRIVAEQYYGNRNLSKYIVEHNSSVITNPNLVPVGTKLSIPELEPNN
jgi:nucleoid-associated protein YgaU